MIKESPDRSIAWWSWWGNPTLGMHEDHRFKHGIGFLDEQDPDYYRILELRSQLELDELPDELLKFDPEIRFFSLLSSDEFQQLIKPFSYWLLDSSVLHARPQEWEESYGVNSPDEIRIIVSERAELPKELSDWQSGSTRNLNLNLKTPLNLIDRSQLCFFVFLQSFLPKVAKRTSLLLPERIINTAKFLEKIPSEYWELFYEWARPIFNKISDAVNSKYILTQPELDYSFMANDEELNSLLENSNGGENV